MSISVVPSVNLATRVPCRWPPQQPHRAPAPGGRVGHPSRSGGHRSGTRKGRLDMRPDGPGSRVASL